MRITNALDVRLLFTKNIRRDIEEKQLKLEYIQNCANDLLKKEVDARGLTLNVAELAKFAQQLKTLLKRIDRLRDNLTEPHSRQPIDAYLADLQDIAVRIQGDLRAKEDSLRAPTPFGVQLEHVPTDFSYVIHLVLSHRVRMTLLPSEAPAQYIASKTRCSQ